MVKNQKPKNKSRKAKVVKMKVVSSKGLDQYGSAYAKLLVDPCNAALVHPVYPGGDAGFLFRAEAFTTAGGGVTETSGILHWSPGYVNSSNTELLAITAASGSGTNTAAAIGAVGPGKTFLGNNAAGVRCVAACVKVTYPGAESGRSGRVHYGITQASVLDAGDVTSADNMAPLLQNFTRTPPESFEVVWRPGIADTEMNDPGVAANAQLRDRKSAITIAWAGLPAGVGLTFHFTAVYEWLPKTSTGVGGNATGKNPSRNTFDEILDAVQSSGFSWVRNAAGAAAHSFGQMAGGMGMAALTNAFGLMPAGPRVMARRRFLT